MSELPAVMAAAAEVEAFCRGHGRRFCFIGGIAVQRWGMPNFTQDVDLTLLTGFKSQENFIDPVLQQFPGRRRHARQSGLGPHPQGASAVAGNERRFVRHDLSRIDCESIGINTVTIRP
jgi:hypothetical protein